MIEASKKAVDTVLKRKPVTSKSSIPIGRRLPEKINFRQEAREVLERISPRIPVIGTKLCNYNKQIKCDFNSKYRTADGTCNNKKNAIWGRSLTPFERFLFPMYEDGINSPRTLDVNGSPLPESRKISTEIHQKSSPSSWDKLAHFAMEYGQFVSHDIMMNALSKGRYMSNLDCCSTKIRSPRRNCFPISIPKNDPFFGQPHIRRTCMNFVRSLSTPGLDCKLGVRQQMNQVTHYLDGSAVYGSKKSVMDSLRLKTDGLLKSSEGGKLLPKDMSRTPTCRLPTSNSRIKCFKAGDVRVNQQPALISLHTIWMREHNRVAKLLKASNPGWNDEKLFQEARKIVGAEIQHVTYNEYLKKILGPDIMNRFDLNPRTSGYFTGYTEKAKPMIRNSFMAAAYRFGHSMIDRKFAFHPPTSPNFNSDLRNVMLRPDWIYRNNGVSSVTRGLYETNSQKVDRLMTWEVTRHLFESSAGTGMDLAATNIQRGRDHGIASYNMWRNVCGLPVVNNFNVGVPGGLNDHDATTAAKFKTLYASVDDIDLFTGGVSEINLPGAKVGPTFACLVGIQFKALKYGDRFFYESNTDVKIPLNLLEEIRKTSMAKIICDNTDISQIPPDVFLKSSSSNSEVPCSSLPGVSLCINGGWSSWKRRGCMETRRCTNPSPSKCGKICNGPSFRTVENRQCRINIFDDILARPPVTLGPKPIRDIRIGGPVLPKPILLSI
ncbi:hypothetical protein FSP39_004362 [Pinctada imbricata]|uniref:Uncharacterized protein n=1 Tax=Pinctada imbricata TaxID=66713 RepID=A0AA88XZ75_PINIB|nr:hypothetical protein FSP39_004362 [Pinctada imbricata]